MTIAFTSRENDATVMDLDSQQVRGSSLHANNLLECA